MVPKLKEFDSLHAWERGFPLAGIRFAFPAAVTDGGVPIFIDLSENRRTDDGGAAAAIQSHAAKFLSV